VPSRHETSGEIARESAEASAEMIEDRDERREASGEMIENAGGTRAASRVCVR
jgi:hypothetical protein